MPKEYITTVGALNALEKIEEARTSIQFCIEELKKPDINPTRREYFISRIDEKMKVVDLNVSVIKDFIQNSRVLKG